MQIMDLARDGWMDDWMSISGRLGKTGQDKEGKPETSMT